MSITVGIDIGGSTTKIVGLQDGKMISPFKVKATDPVTSLYGAFGRFIAENALKLSEIQQIMVTGVGASFIGGDIYQIPTKVANEMTAIGLGGLHLSGLTDALVVSMGTGTAFVRASEQEIVHIGGSGVGGGTLLGLGRLVLNVRDFDTIVALAAEGNLANVDLSIGDISSALVSNLPAETVAANFGKISDMASKSDIALGIINMVFQSIAMMAVFATRAQDCRQIVATGNLTTVPQIHEIFGGIEQLFGVKYLVPQSAEYATALGAAISHKSALQR